MRGIDVTLRVLFWNVGGREPALSLMPAMVRQFGPRRLLTFALDESLHLRERAADRHHRAYEVGREGHESLTLVAVHLRSKTYDKGDTHPPRFRTDRCHGFVEAIDDGPAGYFWHMPDQVLVRAELIDHLGAVDILDMVEQDALVSDGVRKPSVSDQTRVTGELVVHAFYLVSAKVGYRYLLFRASHGLGFPVTIFDSATENSVSLECNNSIELERALQDLFQHPITQQIVGQLRNLSRQAS